MHRLDNSKFLLYIEPLSNFKSKEPVDDELVKIMKLAIERSTIGASNYSQIDSEPRFHEHTGFKGWHTTDCGERSDNHDYLLENGMITNSLAPFYLMWYRTAIPQTEMEKVKELLDFYAKQ